MTEIRYIVADSDNLRHRSVLVWPEAADIDRANYMLESSADETTVRSLARLTMCSDDTLEYHQSLVQAFNAAVTDRELTLAAGIAASSKDIRSTGYIRTAETYLEDLTSSSPTLVMIKRIGNAGIGLYRQDAHDPMATCSSDELPTLVIPLVTMSGSTRVEHYLRETGHAGTRLEVGGLTSRILAGREVAAEIKSSNVLRDQLYPKHTRGKYFWSNVKPGTQLARDIAYAECQANELGFVVPSMDERTQAMSSLLEEVLKVMDGYDTSNFHPSGLVSLRLFFDTSGKNGNEAMIQTAIDIVAKGSYYSEYGTSEGRPDERDFVPYLVALEKGSTLTVSDLDHASRASDVVMRRIHDAKARIAESNADKARWWRRVKA